MNEEEATAVVAPLKSLHDLRNKMKGHASSLNAKSPRETMIAKHGDLKSHFRALVEDCDRTIDLMTELTDAGVR